MHVGKGVLLGPSGARWVSALCALPEWPHYFVHVPGRRDLLAFAKLHPPHVVLLGAHDSIGIPTLPLLSRLQVAAPRCHVVCLHDEPVVSLPSAWSSPREDSTHHVFLTSQTHAEASIEAWRLVWSLLLRANGASMAHLQRQDPGE